MWLVVWVFVCENLPAAETGGLTETQIKAAYVFNFTKFTEWPASNSASEDTPIVIGVLGDDSFGKILAELTKGEVVRKHPLVVTNLNASDDLGACQVLFVRSSDKEQIPALLLKLKGTPVLTVADTDGFVDRGGMVNFITDQQKVKFEINQTAVEESGLRLSSKVFQIAKRIVKANQP